jgi:general stress protein YciG
MKEKGKKKMKRTLIERFGSPEAVLAWRREIGRKGGLKSRGGGVTGNPEKAYEIGILGGRPRKDKSNV